MSYRYTAFTKDGARKHGVIEADTVEHAKSLVQAEGLYVSEIAEAGTSNAARTKSRSGIFGASSLKNVASFTRQMSVLISSGTPIVQSLEAVERQTIDPKWKSVLQGLRERVEEGNQLSDAMAMYPAVFDDVYRAMIAAGESGGSRSGLGTEDFAGLRSHQLADSPRHVAWKAVARGQPLLTKQFAGASTTQVWLDWFEMPPELGIEARLSRLTRWLIDAHAQGLAYRVRLPGKEIPLGMGARHYQDCLEALALHGD